MNALRTHVPVEIVRGQQFAEIQTRGLLQKLGFRRVCSVVTERDQHGTRKVDDLSIELEDFGGCLDLGLKTMRRRSEPVAGGQSPRMFRSPRWSTHIIKARANLSKNCCLCSTAATCWMI